MENSSTSKRSQLSPERWPADAFPLPYTLLSIVGVVAILIATLFMSLAGTIWYSAHGGQALGIHLDWSQHDPATMPPAQTMVLFVLQDLSYLPVIAFIFYVVPRLAKRSLAQLGLRRITKQDLRAGLIGLALTWIAVTVVSVIFDAITHQQHHQKELALFENLNGVQACISIITAVVLAPIFEEVAFRLFLLNALLRYVPAGVAIVIDGLLFGIAHGQLDVAPALAACGMVLAFVYFRSGSLWTNIIAHALFNGITAVAVIFFHARN